MAKFCFSLHMPLVHPPFSRAALLLFSLRDFSYSVNGFSSLFYPWGRVFPTLFPQAHFLDPSFCERDDMFGDPLCFLLQDACSSFAMEQAQPQP